MKLFIAINFNDEIKYYFNNIINQLKKYNIDGKFTVINNIHLTLNYIGETDKVRIIENIIDKINFESFYISINELGLFKNNILWVGIEENIHLNNIYYFLYEELYKNDFILDSRDFKPHITIARKTIFPDDFFIEKFTLAKKNILVNKISLMKSERIDNNLIYTEIYKKY